MKRKPCGKAFVCLLCVLLTAALILFYPAIRENSARSSTIPPGVRAGQRQLLTVWLCGDCLTAAPWLRSQAAAYTKAHRGTHIWIRSASAQDVQALSKDAALAPDLFLFSSGTVSAQYLRTLDDLPVQAAYLSAGKYETRQLAVPLCMDGYVLACPAASSAATAAPTSLFGVTPTPQIQPVPQPTALPRDDWPASILADTAYGALVLEHLGVHAEIAWLPASQIPAAFQAGKAAAALLTGAQAENCLAAGFGMDLLAASDITDRVVFAALGSTASNSAADFLNDLLSPSAQQALSNYALLPARNGITLYGQERPVLFALQSALQSGTLNGAFSSQAQMQAASTLSQALLDNNLP